jgi:23S rRNA (adenine2503-C2)-methyltransferase
VKALSDLPLEELQRRLAGWGFKPSHAARLLRSFYAARGGRFRLRERDVRTSQAAAAADRRENHRIRGHAGLPRRPGGRVHFLAGGLRDGLRFLRDGTQSGFERNLSAGEMVEQFLHLRREARAVGRRLQTVVFMGMGEPMLNLENVLEAIRRMAGNGLGASAGGRSRFRRWGSCRASMRWPTPGWGSIWRSRCMRRTTPRARSCCRPGGAMAWRKSWRRPTGFRRGNNDRPMSIQYCLLQGVNDSPEQARQLAALLENRRMHVNLLHYNPTGCEPERADYEPSSPEAAEAFIAELRSRRVVAHFRRPRGRDIDAACGQLRQRSPTS